MSEAFISLNCRQNIIFTSQFLQDLLNHCKLGISAWRSSHFSSEVSSIARVTFTSPSPLPSPFMVFLASLWRNYPAITSNLPSTHAHTKTRVLTESFRLCGWLLTKITEPTWSIRSAHIISIFYRLSFNGRGELEVLTNVGDYLFTSENNHNDPTFLFLGAATAHFILILSQYNLFDYFTGTYQPQRIRVSLPIDFLKDKKLLIKTNDNRKPSSRPWIAWVSFDYTGNDIRTSRSTFSYNFWGNDVIFARELFLQSIIEEADFVRFWSIVTPLMANSS